MKRAKSKLKVKMIGFEDFNNMPNEVFDQLVSLFEIKIEEMIRNKDKIQPVR